MWPVTITPLGIEQWAKMFTLVVVRTQNGSHKDRSTAPQPHTHTQWPFHTHHPQLPEVRNISLTMTSLHCNIIDSLWLLWWRCGRCDTPHLLISIHMLVCVWILLCCCHSGCEGGERGGKWDIRRWHHLLTSSCAASLTGKRKIKGKSSVIL